MKYVPVINMKDGEFFDSFGKAFEVIYDYIKESEDITWMELESTIWIDNVTNGGRSYPTMFFDARDIMCDSGLIVDGYLKRELL